jgi:hypothetical protein
LSYKEWTKAGYMKLRKELDQLKGAVDDALDEFATHHTGLDLPKAVERAVSTLRVKLAKERVRSHELQVAVDLVAEAFNNRPALEALKTPEFTKGLGLCFILTEKKL